MLSRGFTTVRDVGGANRHYKQATEEWLIPGPRIFQGGPVMSQTGGHGECCSMHMFLTPADFTLPQGDQSDPDGPVSCCPITPGQGHLGAVVDGGQCASVSPRAILTVI